MRIVIGIGGWPRVKTKGSGVFSKVGLSMATDKPALVFRAPLCFELYAISHMLSKILRSPFASRYRHSAVRSSQNPVHFEPYAIRYQPYALRIPYPTLARLTRKQGHSEFLISQPWRTWARRRSDGQDFCWH